MAKTKSKVLSSLAPSIHFKANLAIDDVFPMPGGPRKCNKTIVIFHVSVNNLHVKLLQFHFRIGYS